MKPPSEQARRMLARYKEAVALDSGEKARLGDVLKERALRGDLPRFDVHAGTPSAPHATLAQKLWSSTLAKGAVGLVVLGAAVGAGYQLQKDARPGALDAPSAIVEPTPPPAHVVVADPVGPATPASAEDPGDLGPTRPPTARSPRSKLDQEPAVPAPSTSEPTIDEEVRLVKGAQAALRAGNTSRALELLSAHAARFPNGKLTTLRQVTHMLALCQSGSAQQARQEAASFLAKNPSSPFAERVGGICAPNK
jgi:hypothetical protein